MRMVPTATVPDTKRSGKKLIDTSTTPTDTSGATTIVNVFIIMIIYLFIKEILHGYYFDINRE